MRHLIAVVVAALVLVACAEAGEDSGTEPTETTPVVVDDTSDSTAPAEDEPVGSATTTTTIVRSEEQPDENKLPEPVPIPVPEPPHEPVAGVIPEDLMASITADVYLRAGAAQSDITIVRAERAVWNDGSLGCPIPGEFYTQALVDGYWVVFDHAGQTYDYRASSTGFFKLCEGGGQPPSNPTG